MGQVGRDYGSGSGSGSDYGDGVDLTGYLCPDCERKAWPSARGRVCLICDKVVVA